MNDMTNDVHQDEELENAVRSKIERRTANEILTVLEVVLRTELRGLSEERRRIYQKVRNHCLKEGFIE
jgi:hypothetical protein